jgi:NAD(P)-dependent dehydrogenase (short-subunit alcohol dehydrogenase family)
VVHDYTSFAGAEDLVAQMMSNLGGVDDVVAPIGGWWAGKKLWEIKEADWQNAFVNLATTHMAVARAALPHMDSTGAYTIIVGDSAAQPIPESGLVSMEQAALLMMQRVLDTEANGSKRIFAFMLGPVATEDAEDDGITAAQIGEVAAAASAASGAAGEIIQLHNDHEVREALRRLASARK